VNLCEIFQEIIYKSAQCKKAGVAALFLKNQNNKVFKIIGGFYMKLAIVSNYELIRKGLFSIITRCNNMKINLSVETLNEAIPLIEKEEIDVVFLHLYENNKDELMLIKEMKERGILTRFIILDFDGNKEFFLKAIKCGVEGYILGESNEIEILHAINQIYKGKKHYSDYFVR